MQQHPLMNVAREGGVSSEELERGRVAAGLELVRGLEGAISALHRFDVEERAWFAARLREARMMAGLAPVELARSSRVLSDVRSA